jgi:hypothetical protein
MLIRLYLRFFSYFIRTEKFHNSNNKIELKTKDVQINYIIFNTVFNLNILL